MPVAFRGQHTVCTRSRLSVLSSSRILYVSQFHIPHFHCPVLGRVTEKTTTEKLYGSQRFKHSSIFIRKSQRIHRPLLWIVAGLHCHNELFEFGSLWILQTHNNVLPRDADMLAWYWESQFCRSVWLSVRHTRALWRNERTYCRYFDTTWKSNHSSFLPTELGATSLCTWNLRLNWPTSTSIQKCLLRPIFAYIVSTVRASEKGQLSRIGSRSRTFQRAIEEVRMLALRPQKGA